jgi:hypothetical protein
VALSTKRCRSKRRCAPARSCCQTLSNQRQAACNLPPGLSGIKNGAPISHSRCCETSGVRQRLILLSVGRQRGSDGLISVEGTLRREPHRQLPHHVRLPAGRTSPVGSNRRRKGSKGGRPLTARVAHCRVQRARVECLWTSPRSGGGFFVLIYRLGKTSSPVCARLSMGAGARNRVTSKGIAKGDPLRS